MIINMHDHPYDPKSTQMLFPYFSKFATDRHLLDGSPVDRFLRAAFKSPSQMPLP